MRGIAFISGELGPLHGVGHTCPYGVLIGSDHQPDTIFGGIDIRGRNFGQERSRPFADIIADIVFGHYVFHHVENGFVDRRVNHLAFACQMNLMQRHHRAKTGMHRSQRIADRDSCPAGR